MADSNESNREKALSDVKMYIANDWELAEETPEYFLLTRRKQSLLIHLILLGVTLGVGNIIYYFMSKKTKKILK